MSVTTSNQTTSSATGNAPLDLILLLQRQILEQIAAKQPLTAIFEQICHALERSVPGSTALIRMLDTDQRQLRLACAPSLSPHARDRICSIQAVHGNGSCASAALLGTPIFVENIITDSRWSRRLQETGAMGFKASWAWPIMGDNHMICGTLALALKAAGPPTQIQCQLAESAAHLIGIAVRRNNIEQALHSTTVRLHQVTNALPGVVFQYRQQCDGMHRFTFVSHQCEQIMGLDADEMMASFSTFWSALHPQDREQLHHHLQQSSKTGQPWQQEFRLLDNQGRCRWIQVSALPDALATDGSLHWNGIFLDISHAKASAEQLALAAAAFATTSEGILITGPDDRITDANDAFCNITGYNREELVGQTPALLKSGQHDLPFFQELYRHLAENNSWRGEIWNRHKNGRTFLHRLHIRLVRDERGEIRHKVAVYTDISQQHESEKQLRYISDHDTLTHLPNRQLFNTVTEQWLRHQSFLTVMMVDLDRFKHINESLGHEAGDQLLLQVAELLRQQMTPVDMLARLGGDEFAILLPMVDNQQDAEQIAQLLVALLDRPFEVCGRRYFTTASIGVALAPDHGSSLDVLIKHADTALHHAKNRGRNAYSVYQPKLGKQVDNWLKLEPELRNALENDQFLLHYQPQVDGASGKIIGAEALIRWQHPEFGMVSPGSFLPIAEEIGLMPRLGQWVLNTGCAQLANWLSRGLNEFSLSINLAGQQIMQDGLTTQISELIERYQLPASSLELEILETFVMEHEAQTASVLMELRELGIELALDDFGTGYSSLAYLKKLPIQKVKIDQSLVRDIPDDPNDEAIARAVIALGRSLSLKVCAEGVETDAQHQFLRSESCDQLQGYLFSRPVAATELEALLRGKGRL